MKTVSNVAQELLEKVRFDWDSFDSWCDEDSDIRAAKNIVASCVESNSVDALYKAYGSISDLDETIPMIYEDATDCHNNYDYDNCIRLSIYQDLLEAVRALMIQEELCKLGSDAYSFQDQGYNGMYIFVDHGDCEPEFGRSNKYAIGVDSGVEALSIIESLKFDLSF